MKMKDHLTLVAALRIATALLMLGIAAIVFFAVVGGGLISGDAEAIRITAWVGTLIAGLLTFLGLPSLVAGIGLLRRWGWARWIAIVLSALDLVAVPVGTLIGLYSIWVLLQDEVAQQFVCCGKVGG